MDYSGRTGHRTICAEFGNSAEWVQTNPARRPFCFLTRLKIRWSAFSLLSFPSTQPVKCCASPAASAPQPPCRHPPAAAVIPPCCCPLSTASTPSWPRPPHPIAWPICRPCPSLLWSCCTGGITRWKVGGRPAPRVGRGRGWRRRRCWWSRGTYLGRRHAIWWGMSWNLTRNNEMKH